MELRHAIHYDDKIGYPMIVFVWIIVKKFFWIVKLSNIWNKYTLKLVKYTIWSFDVKVLILIEYIFSLILNLNIHLQSDVH
jgi:hypothetical protein